MSTREIDAEMMRLARARHAVTQQELAEAAGVLREVRSVENGKQVSRFYGDPRTAFAPFMLPAQRIVGVSNAPARR